MARDSIALAGGRDMSQSMKEELIQTLERLSLDNLRIGNIKPLCTRTHPLQPPSTPSTPPRATGNPPPAAPERQRLGAAGQRRRARTGRGLGDGQPARLLGC